MLKWLGLSSAQVGTFLAHEHPFPGRRQGSRGLKTIQGRTREKKTVPEVAEQLSPLYVGADQMKGHSDHPKPARRGGSTTV